MGATYRKRGRRSWLVTVHWDGAREFKTVHSLEDAKALVQQIHKQELAGVNVVEAIRTAREAAATEPMPAWPRLRDALPLFIQQMTERGEWTGSTPIKYGQRLTRYVYDYVLSDGRKLGDLPVDQVTEQMIGGVLDEVRTTRDSSRAKSVAVQEHIRCPLKRFYRDLIRKHGFTGPNPAADLKDYMSRYPSKRARQGGYAFFRQEEGPQLFATCAAVFPRWLPFIGCGTLAGLRWGEAAALEWTDLDFDKRVIHVQRSMSDKARIVKLTKDKEDRYVPMSPLLASWLLAHQERVAQEGGRHGWSAEQRALVFPNRVGRIGGYSAFLEHCWQPLLSKAGLRYRKPHSMRHTFATWALEGNEAKAIKPVPIHHVRDWMGHASVEETERYLHPERARYARSVDNLDAYVVG